MKDVMNYKFNKKNTIKIFLELSRKSAFDDDLSSIDWNHLISLSLTHQILPLLHQNLSKFKGRNIPTQYQKAIDEHIKSHQSKVLSMTFELIRVLDILKQNNILALPYKGPLLALIAYGNLTLRSFNDLDILVREEDYFKPIEILAKEGYQPLSYLTFQSEGERKLRYYYGEYTVFRGKGSICIDIHRRCLGDGNLTLYPDLSHVWKRLVPITIANQKILTFSHTDLLMYLCMNGFKDGWDNLRGLCDISTLICRQSDDIDWRSLRAEAEDLRISRILWLSLLLAQKLLKTPVPNWIIQDAKSDESAEWMSNRLYDLFMYELETMNKRSPIEAIILKWVGLRYWKERRKYVFGSLERILKLSFAINYRDIEFVDLPTYFHFFYYFIRPLRLILEHKQNLIKFMFK